MTNITPQVGRTTNWVGRRALEPPEMSSTAQKTPIRVSRDPRTLDITVTSKLAKTDLKIENLVFQPFLDHFRDHKT